MPAGVRHLLSVLLAAIPALASSPARTEDPVAWVEALKTPSTAPHWVPDVGDYGYREAGPDPKEEARLVAPFEHLSTEQARVVIPPLLEMLDEHRGALGFYRNRAWGALFRISFRHSGGFGVVTGCAMPEGALEANARREKEMIEDWRRWWTENRRRQIGEWRQRAIEEKLASFRARDGDAAVKAVEELALLGPLCMRHLDFRTIPELAHLVEDENADPKLRERCLRALIAFEIDGAVERTEALAKEKELPQEVRHQVLRELESLEERGIPVLISLARYFAESADRPPDEEELLMFTDAVLSVQRVSRLGKPWMPFTSRHVDERMRVVENMEAWWAEHRSLSSCGK